MRLMLAAVCRNTFDLLLSEPTWRRKRAADNAVDVEDKSGGQSYAGRYVVHRQFDGYEARI